MLTKKWVFVRKNKKLSARPLVMVRREEEQLTGRALFKARTNLKVSSVPSLSPSSGHELPSKNEAMFVPPVANQSLYWQRKIKAKSKKIGLKVA
jgi:hypothetical protein